VTPLEAVRAIAAVANGGKILRPTILDKEYAEVNDLWKDSIIREEEFSSEDLRVVHEGMRQGVTTGTSVGLNVPYVKIAAKTGTAEIGAAKKYIHSWSAGFFPFDHPKYAFVVIMEHGPATNPIGATSVVRLTFDWMNMNTPEYFQ
jgi:cell division protein FtsI/penicillin-binding protein 2